MLAAQAEAVVAVAGREEPIQYMLRIMNDPSVEPARRDSMARAAAPYRHAQLQAIAHRHLDSKGKPIAPKVVVSILQAPPEPPRLTIEGPKNDKSVHYRGELPQGCILPASTPAIGVVPRPEGLPLPPGRP